MDALTTTATILDDIHGLAPWVESVLPLVPDVGAQAVIVVKLADNIDVLAANALRAIAEKNGVNPLDALDEFLNHITPGMPNSPALSPAPATAPGV